jgi:hypothetical protein
MPDRDLERFRNVDPRETRPGAPRLTEDDLFSTDPKEAPIRDDSGVSPDMRGMSLTEAYELRQQEKEQRLEQERGQKHWDELTADAEIIQKQRDTVSWNSPEEKAAVTEHFARVQQFQQEEPQFREGVRQAGLQMHALYQSGRTLEAQQAEQLIAQAIEARNGQKAELVREGQFGTMINVWKARQAARQELERICPGLGDGDTEDRFKRWVWSKKHVSWGDVEGETDPRKIREWYKEWTDGIEAERVKTARREVAGKRLNSRGPGSQTSSADAMKAFRESGKMTDLLNARHLAKLEKARKV